MTLLVYKKYSASNKKLYLQIYKMIKSIFYTRGWQTSVEGQIVNIFSPMVSVEGTQLSCGNARAELDNMYNSECDRVPIKLPLQQHAAG